MTKIIQLETQRLILRQWINSDFAEFFKLNSDPDVMQYFPDILSKQESDQLAQRIQTLITTNGWGFWAIEVKDTRQFIGFTGLNKPQYKIPCSPCTEIGWRLSKSSWGKGYATEAAKAALSFAFESLSLSEVYAFTTVKNDRSRAVMERLQMINTNQNFHHPEVPIDSHLREHVLYKITNEQWFSQ